MHSESAAAFWLFGLEGKRKSNEVPGTGWEVKASWVLPPEEKAYV